MKDLKELINEVSASKDYIVMNVISGENPEVTYASFKQITDVKWMTTEIFGGETEHEPLTVSIIELIKGEDFKHNGHIIIEGDAGFIIIVNKSKVIDLGDI